MLYELIDDTMTYAGNVPEIFSLRDPLYIAPTQASSFNLNTEDDAMVLVDTLDFSNV